MVVVEILGLIAFVMLAGATTAMAVVGGLGALGVASLERCPRCRKLSLQPCGNVQPCPRCVSPDENRRQLQSADNGWHNEWQGVRAA
jgi:hypothetical protein